MRSKNVALVLACALCPAVASATSTHYDDTSGEPVRWHRAAIELVVDPGSCDGDFADLEGIVARAAARWSDVPGAPQIAVRNGAADPVGYDSSGRPNRNSVVVYRSTPPFPLDPALAVTLITSRRGTGEVLDADVFINAVHYPFAALAAQGMLGVPGAPYDIENVVTHELGHVLGLGEDYDDATVTMSPTSRPGEVTKRALHDGDRVSLEAAYPAGTDGGATAPGCTGPARVAPHGRDPGLALAGLITALLVAGGLRLRSRRGALVFAAGAALVVAAPEGAPGRAAVAHETQLAAMPRVTRVALRRVGGVLVTRAQVVDAAGVERSIELVGGVDGDIEQRVTDGPSGSDLAPGAGVELDGARVVRVHPAR